MQYSKLGKVMRHISSLDQNILPKDDKYNIRRRADVLLERWQVLIASSGETGAHASAANGAEKNIEQEKPKEKQEEVNLSEVKELPVNGVKTGTAPDAPADPPVAEEEVAMDTADD